MAEDYASIYGLPKEEEKKHILDFVANLGKETGSKLLDTLMNLDRPRNMAFMAAREAIQKGDVSEAAKLGWSRDEDFRTIDILKKRFPDWVAEHPYVSMTAGVAGDIALDPLTYIAGVGLIGKGLKGLSMITPSVIKNAAKGIAQTPLATALNITAGETAAVKRAGMTARDLIKGQNVVITRGVRLLDNKIKKIAKAAGVSSDDAGAAIVASIESKRKVAESLTKIKGREAAELQKIADGQSAWYKKILDEEVAAGVPTFDIMRRGGDLGVKGYVPHVLSAVERRRRKSGTFRDFFRDPSKHKSTLEREIDDTIEAVNRTKGRDFFHNNPALLQGIRMGRYTSGMAGVKYLDDVAKLGKTPDELKAIAATGENTAGWRSVEGINRVAKEEKLFHPNVARMIEQQFKMINDPAAINPALRLFDNVQNLWKMWSLAVRPAYHSRNIVGNIWNAYSLAGVKSIKPYKDAMKIQNAALPKELVPKWIRAAKLGTFRSGFTDKKMIKRVVDDGTGTKIALTDRAIWEEALKRGVIGRGQYSGDITRDLELLLEGALGKATILGKTVGAQAAPLRAGFAFGHAAETNARLAVFVDRLRKGDDLESAALKVKQALFDYSDLSAFERSVMKRIIPFYTWSRKNIPAQMKGILTHPERYQKINTLRMNIEHDAGRPDPEMTAWWGGRVPIYIGKDQENDVWNMISLLNYAPVADLERLGSPKHLIAEMATPLLKEPIEAVINYDSFRRRAISEYPGQTEDFFGVALPAHIAKFANVLVPIAEINRANPYEIFGTRKVDPITGMSETTNSFEILKPYMSDRTWDTIFEPISTPRQSQVDIDRGLRLLRYLTGMRTYQVVERPEFEAYQMNKDLKFLQTKLFVALKQGKPREVQELYRLITDYLSGKVPPGF